MSSPVIGGRQWMRRIQVVVGSGGSGISIDTLRVKFKITKSIEPVPNPALIQIYNLNPTHEQAIREEYTDIILNAGYVGNTQLIFRGNIKHVFRYREGNDSVTEIEAGDGDQDYRQSFVNVTLAAGSTDSDLIGAALNSFYKVKAGVTQVSKAPYIRGRVLSGSTRQILADCARNNIAHWSIQDEQLYLIPINNVLPGTAIVVNGETGMIGTPTINSTNKGIAVKCLLNPQIKVHGAIWLDNSSIKQQVRRAKLFSHAGAKLSADQPQIRLDPDGIYKVFRLIHNGDNYGKDFVTEIACIGLNQPIPAQTGDGGLGGGAGGS